MGCDIHSFTEVQLPDGSWAVPEVQSPLPDRLQHWGDAELLTDNPYISRDYTLFGLLAEVRRPLPETNPFAWRDFPDDASAPVKEEYGGWGLDAHTPSWLLLSELKDKAAELLILGNEKAQEALSSLRQLLEVMPKTGYPDDKVRLVFWFDN